jgi:hypothetical protein
MSSFSCPHIDMKNSYCVKLEVECIPGRKGCVINGRKFGFAFPAEERIKNKALTNTKNINFLPDK